MHMYHTTPRRSSCAEIHRSNGVLDSVPPNFDPASCPIIARHWFGMQPSLPIRKVATAGVLSLKRQHQVEHVYRLGPRAVGELLDEVAQGENLDRALEAYQRLTPELLAALGGDRFPPAPIHEVEP